MIAAIIFDCFGVVISDGLEVVTDKLSKTNPEARNFIAKVIKQNNSGLIDPDESNRLISDHLHIPVEQWQQMVATGEIKNKPMLEWIVVLREKYKTALLSNVGRGSLKRRFSTEELNKLFDVVIVSAEVGIVKPDPEIYTLTAKRLGEEPKACVFIDDRESYVKAAQANGMLTILYKSFKQTKSDLELLLSAK